MQIVRYIILNLLIILSISVSAQDDIMTEQQWEAEVENSIRNFIDELNQLSNTSNMRIRISEASIESGAYTRILNQKISLMTSKYKHLDFRWNVMIQMNQVIIAENESLMELMTQAQQIKQAIADTIASQQKQYDAINDFVEAESFIESQDSIYSRLYKEAFGLSLVQNLTPKLEKVKGEEQAMFEKIQNSYDKSKAAVEIVPILSKRATILDDKFYNIKIRSDKIQALEYKPFIQRIKDYLIGLACVAIILMFISSAVAKLNAAKKAREMLKKQKELFNKTNGKDYPTI